MTDSVKNIFRTATVVLKVNGATNYEDIVKNLMIISRRDESYRIIRVQTIREKIKGKKFAHRHKCPRQKRPDINAST